MFVCAGELENFDFAKSIGVGLINSAITLSNICLKEMPERLIFIASAGSYDKKKIGDIFYSMMAYNLELSMLDGKSYTPIDNSISIDSFIDSSDKFHKPNHIHIASNISFVKVNSSNYITSTDQYNHIFVKNGILLENMEFFSVLQVARFYNIPALGIFCVSNYVGKNSHEEFLENHGYIKQKLTEFVKCNF